MLDAVRLPCFYRPGSACADGLAPFARARYFWPGLPLAGETDSDSVWTPDNLPFTERESLLILESFRKLDNADLEVMRHSLTRQKIAGEILLRGELDAIGRFAAGSPEPDAGQNLAMLRRQAHKTLLWLWQKREREEEIRRLEISCARAEAKINRLFSEDGCEPCDGDENYDFSLQPESGWKICLASAAIFIPQDVWILVEGQMAADIMEYLDFESAGDAAPQSGARIARAPLWRALGMSRASVCGALRELYSCQRGWLAAESV